MAGRPSQPVSRGAVGRGLFIFYFVWKFSINSAFCPGGRHLSLSWLLDARMGPASVSLRPPCVPRCPRMSPGPRVGRQRVLSPEVPCAAGSPSCARTLRLLTAGGSLGTWDF